MSMTQASTYLHVRHKGIDIENDAVCTADILANFLNATHAILSVN